jgi:hypothetical protein
MQIEDRLEAFFTNMQTYEFGLKVVMYIGAILIAYNYFFYLSLVGMVIGIPLYYYIQTNGIRSIADFHKHVFPIKNVVVVPESRPTIQTPA